MASRGRPNKYLTEVKERFDEIAELAKQGATDKEIAEYLHIAPRTLCEYKNKYMEFSDLLKGARKKPIDEIKRALFRRAIGFDYVEKKVVEKSDGGIETTIITKHALPDPACAMILLKHWARDEGWTNDPQLLKIKQEELALKKQQMERENW